MAATRVALSMDEAVLARARRISRARGTSISKLFVSFISSLDDVDAADRAALPPLTRQALGIGRPETPVSADWDYRDLLADELLARHGG